MKKINKQIIISFISLLSLVSFASESFGNIVSQQRLEKANETIKMYLHQGELVTLTEDSYLKITHFSFSNKEEKFLRQLKMEFKIKVHEKDNSYLKGSYSLNINTENLYTATFNIVGVARSGKGIMNCSVCIGSYFPDKASVKKAFENFIKKSKFFNKEETKLMRLEHKIVSEKETLISGNIVGKMIAEEGQIAEKLKMLFGPPRHYHATAFHILEKGDITSLLDYGVFNCSS